MYRFAFVVNAVMSVLGAVLFFISMFTVGFSLLFLFLFFFVIIQCIMSFGFLHMLSAIENRHSEIYLSKYDQPSQQAGSKNNVNGYVKENLVKSAAAKKEIKFNWPDDSLPEKNKKKSKNR